MMDWVTFVRGPLGATARRAANLPLVRPSAVAAYGVIARLGARWLARVPHARAVYMTGSMLEPRSVVPGVSDVDLLVVADLPTLDAELEFRRGLAENWASLTRVFPIFYNLDYVDVADAPFVSAFGQNWIADFDRRFRFLAGSALKPIDAHRPQRERANERLIHALLKWRKSGCHLLDPRLEVEPWILIRAAERLLALVAAHRLGVSIETPLDELLARCSPTGAPLPDRSAARARVRACLVTALEILETFAEECSAEWMSDWHVDGGAPATEPSAETRREARALVSSGFASVYVVPRGLSGHGHQILAIGADGESAEAVVARAERAFAHLSTVTPANRFPARPMFLTRRAWRAAALIEPSPFVAAHVAAGRCVSLGEPVPPPAPPRAALEAILRARAVELFVRPRTRLLRVGKATAASRIADDLALMPAIAHAIDGGVVDLRAERCRELVPPSSSERALLEAIRSWVGDRRERFLPELRARTANEHERRDLGKSK